MWTVETITEYCKELAANFKLEFDCPVKINSRLTRTLGRICYLNDFRHDEPTVLEISKHLIDTGTDESIKSVIEHELCHWAAIVLTGRSHGHDDYFKSLCHQIGCTNDGVSTQVDRLVAEEKVYRYTVYCPNCGLLGGYSRMCATLREIDRCTCKKCDSKSLYYKKNW